MELPLETEGRKTTHDFLSLYSSSAHTRRDSSHPQGEELFEKNVTRMKEDIKGGVDSVDHGGIGTYSISYLNLKTANSFTLWDESHPKMKETHILPEAGVSMLGRRSMPFLEKPSQSSSNHRHNANATNFGSFSSSQPSSSEKNQTFMDMIMTSAKSNLEEDDDDDEEEEEFNIKKEPASHSKGNFSVKPEVKTIEQKPNTPRSKHSATEQRRRSKINDRFYKLREIIPNSDQKRDKASLLLEVIDYIQFLQEKVNRFENVWNQEASKPMHWRSCQGVSSDSGPNLVESTSLGVRVHHHRPELTSQMQPSIFSLGKMKKEVESGSINISSVYSQGLLNSLGQALQRSGVDVSQASISVEINLGKRRPLVVEDEAGKDLGHAVKKLSSSSRQM